MIIVQQFVKRCEKSLKLKNPQRRIEFNANFFHKKVRFATKVLIQTEIYEQRIYKVAS